MGKSLGFHAKDEEERTPSELERKTGINFIEKDKEPFPNEIGKYVGVHLAGTTLYGVYNGVNEKGFIVLIPFIDSEFIPMSRMNHKEGKYEWHWENERPNYVRYDAINGLSPARKEHLDRVVSGETVEGLIYQCNNES